MYKYLVEAIVHLGKLPLLDQRCVPGMHVTVPVGILPGYPDCIQGYPLIYLNAARMWASGFTTSCLGIGDCGQGYRFDNRVLGFSLLRRTTRAGPVLDDLTSGAPIFIALEDISFVELHESSAVFCEEIASSCMHVQLSRETRYLLSSHYVRLRKGITYQIMIYWGLHYG